MKTLSPKFLWRGATLPLLLALVLSFPGAAQDFTACEISCAGTPVVDLDADGLSACVEDCLGTSDALVDSDGDGMSDRWEAVYQLDPLENDALMDADGDLITNLEEYLESSDPGDEDSPRVQFFVSPGGTDGPVRGTASAPFRTIAYALSRASSVGAGNAAIVLNTGEYVEDVTLLPGILLRGITSGCEPGGTCAVISGMMLGAEGAIIENLVLAPRDGDDVLLTLDNVSMRVEGVYFRGLSSRLAIGAAVRGEAPREAVFFDCIFSSLDIGMEIFDTIPCVVFSDFRNCYTAQVYVHPTNLPNATTNGLGVADQSNRGWNRFLGGANELALFNGREEAIPVERNEWDMDVPEMVMARIEGPADFEPFLDIGDALLAGAIYCTVWDANGQEPVTGAKVSISPSEVSAVTDNEGGIYAFPVMPEGSYALEVTAPGFEPAEIQVDLERGEIKSVMVPMVEGENGGNRPQCNFGGGSKSLFGAGDGAVALMLLAGMGCARRRFRVQD